MALAGLPTQQYQVYQSPVPAQTLPPHQLSQPLSPQHHQDSTHPYQQQDYRHAPNQQQHQPRPLPPPVPLMSIKVPFPVHLRSHPRVRREHPRVPRNNLHRNLSSSAHADPNPILKNIRSLNY